jgi:glycosyltransferase involved in cell wall biosynthesis
MNVLFLSLIPIRDINERGIYSDLLRQFQRNGHQVVIAYPNERRNKEHTPLVISDNVSYIQVRTLNIQKTGLLEKGISTILIETFFLRSIRKYCSNLKFDLVLYATPPITFSRVVSFIKKRDNAKSYLLLKDIFPQNAVDLEMLKKGGLLHKLFRKKEIKLYEVSDRIGCMSDANANYLIQHNPSLNPKKIEVNPNSIEIVDLPQQPFNIRSKYYIPKDSTIFIYGGNLGKPQGISFLLEVLYSNLSNKKVFFLIIGTGTEFYKIEAWFKEHNPSNAKLISGLHKYEFDILLRSCDVGMIFLDKRFTIPNFPSRLLSYMECKIPVLAATDSSTDLGVIIQDNGFGFWVESGDLLNFNIQLDIFSENKELRQNMGEKGYLFLKDNYSVELSFKKIISFIKNVSTNI